MLIQKFSYYKILALRNKFSFVKVLIKKYQIKGNQ